MWWCEKKRGKQSVKLTDTFKGPLMFFEEIA